MNCFSWIKLIPVLNHLKYWYPNTPSLELPFLRHHLCQISPWLLESLFNVILIMFFIAFPVFPYTVLQVLDIPNHVASQVNEIYYQAMYRS